jgi:hypothetical protein
VSSASGLYHAFEFPPALAEGIPVDRKGLAAKYFSTTSPIYQSGTTWLKPILLFKTPIPMTLF